MLAQRIWGTFKGSTGERFDSYTVYLIFASQSKMNGHEISVDAPDYVSDFSHAVECVINSGKCIVRILEIGDGYLSCRSGNVKLISQSRSS